MALTSGTKLGPYGIIAPLGAGSMDEVYRARDARLGREVAVKVLPESFAADADRLRRFEQEARAVAALNHPNILALHDIGLQDGLHYLVTELLEGETLSAVMTVCWRRADRKSMASPSRGPGSRSET
jgi:eukaryotic-like serine/threonine-protein kinase